MNSFQIYGFFFKFNELFPNRWTFFEFDECFSNTEDKCDRSLENLGYNLKTYINTINDTSYEYYLVVEYASSIDEDTKKLDKCTPGLDKKCNSYYASLGI